MSSGQCRFSLKSLCRGCGEEEEKEPRGLHAQELDEVDPDVVDDVHRGVGEARRKVGAKAQRW